jgi:hypothetical protein
MGRIQNLIRKDHTIPLTDTNSPALGPWVKGNPRSNLSYGSRPFEDMELTTEVVSSENKG